MTPLRALRRLSFAVHSARKTRLQRQLLAEADRKGGGASKLKGPRQGERGATAVAATPSRLKRRSNLADRERKKEETDRQDGSADRERKKEEPDRQDSSPKERGPMP